MKKAAALILVLLALGAFSMFSFAQAFTLPFQSGWENSQGTDITDQGAWKYVNAATVVTSPRYSGSYAAEFDGGASAAECYNNTFIPIQSITLTAYVYFDSLPTSGKVDCANIQNQATNIEVTVGARYDL
jgi:hypothetical protein